MSRTSLQEKRLRFFRRGNTHCPICLTEFPESDVRAGNIVTLEHAPQESLGGKPACLTCKRCNTGAATAIVDQAVARHYQAVERGGYHITIERNGHGHHTIAPEHYDVGDDGTTIAVRTLRDVVGKRRGRFTLRFTESDPDAVLVGLLKSAYLMVFSLLGTAGYRYAQSEAVLPIREQLLSRKRGLFRPLVMDIDDDANALIPEHTVRLLEEYQCWAVTIHNWLVILPAGGSIDRYERIVEALEEAPLTLRSAVVWTSPKFHDSSVFGKKSDKLKTGLLFGTSMTPPDRRRDYVIVYEEADLVVALPVSGPEVSEP
ncbi:MAG: hypothetical protein OXI33_07355 [Chloroflexota bacterium]|nr:hypothetical protein [Chloroflexota bacterium]